MLPSARVIQVDTRGAVILQQESPEVSSTDLGMMWREFDFAVVVESLD